MPINEELKNGIEHAIREQGQDTKLAQRLIAWLNDMSHRELSKQEHSRHLDNVRNAVQTKPRGDGNAD